MEKTKNLLWGLVFILLGVIIGLNSMGITNITIFFSGWWTLFIIIPSFINLFNKKERITSITFLVIGILLLLCAQNILDYNLILKLIFPIILVAIGVSIIFKNKLTKIKVPNVKNSEEYCATFSYQVIDKFPKNFNGANIDAVFGGVKCDLTNTTIKSESVINASAIFGSVEIIVPPNYQVIVESTSVFGVVTNNYETKDSKKIIYIKTLSLFGGVTINERKSKDN